MFGNHSILHCLLMIKYLCRLLPPTSQFTQSYTWSCKQLHQIPKDTNLHQHHCTNLHCPRPPFTVRDSSRHSHSLHLLLFF